MVSFAFRGFAEIGKKIHTVLFGVKAEEPEPTPQLVPHVLHLRKTRCGLCNGRGVHVNPSIDSHGISSEEFAEDPDFFSEYVNGMYDVSCYECNGTGASFEIDRKRTDSAALRAAREIFREEEEYRAECAAERRMGA